MKTVLFVPGFGEDISSRDYAAVLKTIRRQGYHAVFVPIRWNRTTIEDWVDELKKIYSQYDTADIVLAGFSFGAMTVFLAAAHRPPSELWLFSLSPYFAEDIPHLKQWWLKLNGKHRIEEFEKLRFAALAPKITCPVKLFAGEAELTKFESVQHRFNDARRKLHNCEASVVKGAGHDVADSRYIAAITGAI